MPYKNTSGSRRPKLHGQTPTQALLEKRKPVRLGCLQQDQRHALNTVRAAAPGGEVKCEPSILKFGRRLVFPFIEKMEEAGVALTPKSLREVLKRARDEKVLLPAQYRLAKEYALALQSEYRRLHPGQPVSLDTETKRPKCKCEELQEK